MPRVLNKTCFLNSPEEVRKWEVCPATHCKITNLLRCFSLWRCPSLWGSSFHPCPSLPQIPAWIFQTFLLGNGSWSLFMETSLPLSPTASVLWLHTLLRGSGANVDFSQGRAREKAVHGYTPKHLNYESIPPPPPNLHFFKGLWELCHTYPGVKFANDVYLDHAILKELPKNKQPNIWSHSGKM